MQEWAPTFQALGWDVADAMRSHYELYSELMGKRLRTYEDVYTHIMRASERECAPTDVAILHAGGQTLTTQPLPVRESEPAKRGRPSKKSSDHTLRVQAAREEWKLAIANRKVAIEQWDDYVRSLHDKFVSIRDGE